MQRPTRIIRVSLEQYQDGYIATSKSLKGLFISHKSLAEVYKAVPIAIKLLIKAKEGIDVMVEEARQYSQGKHKLDGEIDYTAAEYQKAA